MNVVANAKLPVKIALPIVVMIALGVGLIAYSRSVVQEMSRQTARIADVQAARLEALIHLRGGITEAAR